MYRATRRRRLCAAFSTSIPARTMPVFSVKTLSFSPELSDVFSAEPRQVCVGGFDRNRLANQRGGRARSIFRHSEYHHAKPASVAEQFGFVFVAVAFHQYLKRFPDMASIECHRDIVLEFDERVKAWRL